MEFMGLTVVKGWFSLPVVEACHNQERVQCNVYELIEHGRSAEHLMSAVLA